MAKYIKSHSNYRISSRHQITNSGVIYERDITTIGGISPLATGQSTIYSSGNFIMTINNESGASRHVIKKGWLTNGISGTTWNGQVLQNQTSDVDGSVEANIGFSNDYLNLQSFACYGSLYMLIQNSIGGILDKFPYEIYINGNGTVSNPGNIDIYNNPSQASINELKYFANGGYENYECIEGDETTGCSFTYSPHFIEKEENYCPKAGDRIAYVEFNLETKHNFILNVYYDNNLDVAYSGDSLYNIHIRPKEELGFYDDFIDNLDGFQKCLMGVYAKKKYSAKFEVKTENNGVYYKRNLIFNFPVDAGGYNLASSGFEMTNYLQNLANIGLEYDEKYTDNLYRVVTHESLKNFDWTKDFNGNDNDYNNEYITTGEKLKAMVRIMGYVFDQEKTYIDSISNVNTLTYDNRNNLSDYFLTDSLETDGWIVNNIYPYNLKEFDKTTGKEVSESVWDYDETYAPSTKLQLEKLQENNTYTRQFSEDNTELVTPYSNCENGKIPECVDGKMVMTDIGSRGNDYYYDESDGKVKTVVKNYCDNSEYTMPEVTNIFYKRLRINSKQLLRKKGTCQGIASLMAMFGFKDKKWYTELENRYGSDVTNKKYTTNLTKKLPYDFYINEYTEFAQPIKEKWDATHNMYRIDYLNSCKTIPYTTEEYLNGDYVAYQGLPVAYRDIEDVWLTPTGETSNSGDTTIYEDGNGNKVKARRLYPDFMRGNEYDGDLYYQMNGAWMQRWPYTYDSENNLINNTSFKNSKETLRNVKQVRALTELVSQPMADLMDGIIYYVTDLRKNYAIIDGYLYDLYSDTSDGGDVYYYMTATVEDGMVNIGLLTYQNYIYAYNPFENDNYTIYYLPGMSNGQEVKVYFNPNDTITPFRFFGYDEQYYYHYVGTNSQKVLEECNADDANAVLAYKNQISPNTTEIFLDKSYGYESSGTTNYFRLVSSVDSDTLGNSGWVQLLNNEDDYKKISMIADEYEGNNPHSSGSGYDGGYEYLSYFTKLFKYASLNNYFDETCFVDTNDMYSEIDSIGFSGLTDPFDYSTSLAPYLNSDTKVHAFADTYTTGGTLTKYNLNNKSSLGDYFSITSGLTYADGVSSQIVNTKLVDLWIILHSTEFYSKDGQQEIKHFQDKIMPYVEQMMPSTAICRVRFKPAQYEWILDDDTRTVGVDESGIWKDYFYWTEDGIWKTVGE